MKRGIEMVTTVDFRRLSALLDDETGLDDTLSILMEKLARAAIIDPVEAPPDLVTMNSTIEGTTPDPRASSDAGRRTLTLAYPREANIGKGRISVYAPLGAELLGARAGQVVTWKGVDCVVRQLLVDRILYQPEACGDWNL
jgi:regulator of nucleoside diphosphate kinase